MRHHHDHAAGVGESAQHRHDGPVQCRIQSRGGLVEHQQRRAGQQLQGDRHTFALPAGQFVDAGRGVGGQLEFLEYLCDHSPSIAVGGVGGHPQFRGVIPAPARR